MRHSVQFTVRVKDIFICLNFLLTLPGNLYLFEKTKKSQGRNGSDIFYFEGQAGWAALGSQPYKCNTRNGKVGQWTQCFLYSTATKMWIPRTHTNVK